MTLRGIKSRLTITQSIAPIVAGATQTGAGIDLRNADSAMIIFLIGAIAGAGAMTVKLQDSDDNSTFGDVAAAGLDGTVVTPAVAQTVQRIGYVGTKRYIRAIGTLDSGTSVAIAATAVLGHLHIEPSV